MFPILSICIPTYNRAESLEKTLTSLARQIGNNDRVEVVVCDNASTDNTCEVISKFKIYNNFHFHKNEINIGADKNIVKVLTLGEGTYLKFLNDYLEFQNKSILEMISLVTENQKEKPILFFPDANTYSKRNDILETIGLDAFLKLNPVHSTWLAAIGFWRQDFIKIQIDEQNRKKDLSFIQTQMLFENFKFKNMALTINKKYFINNDIKNRGGYNLFQVFVGNYLNTIIKDLNRDRLISDWTFSYVKRKLLTGFIMPRFILINIKKAPEYNFDMTNTNSIIFNSYKYSALFYIVVIRLFCLNITYKIYSNSIKRLLHLVSTSQLYNKFIIKLV